ncbi:pleckstrin homology domain-containing family F member 1 [Gadus macrocephalus]|uniref:pleckstrin homology domain-containing family F member 1 n=1 Tax=Gadus macrocephalus TaxID=80720 RepID=UPI0028CB7C97|nr:pleckstrin homology domain-containing family F member 1 [Gadus macrocephalus]
MAANNRSFTKVNHARIKAVERSFGPGARPLCKPGRVLVGEGRLLKRSRRGNQPKAFFLFNDVLVYGTVVASCQWHKNRRIVRLEDIELEDHEDSPPMENHWLIRTPLKSFYVAAGCPEEKRAWMERIVECRERLLQGAATRQHSSTFQPFAPTWIPDHVSAMCMRCPNKFSFIQRRHHCRNCGFLVCAACSEQQAVLPNIHRREPQRVCERCHTSLLKGQERTERMGDSRGEGLEVSDDDEGVGDGLPRAQQVGLP